MPVRVLLIFNFALVVGFCYSQNEPNVSPESSIQRGPIPYVNLNNGQQLDSIYYFMRDPQFLSTRHYKYYNSSGLNTNSISFSRNKENNKWMKSFEGSYTYDSYNRKRKESSAHNKIHRNRTIFLAFDTKYDTISNVIYSNFFFWNIGERFLKDMGHEKNNYTEYGLLEKKEYHTWRGRIIPVYSYSQADYTYYKDGNLKEYTISFLGKRMKKTEAAVRDSYFYDENGNITKKLSIHWNRRTNEWKTVSKRLYYSENLLINQIDIYTLKNENYELSAKKIYFYDNQKLIKFQRKTLDNKSQKMIYDRMETFKYDDDLLLNHIRCKWDTTLNDWVQSNKTSWKYNDHGNISEIYYYSNSSNNMLEMKSQRKYFWRQLDTLSISQKYRSVNLSKIYPNPVTDRLMIRTIDTESLPISFYMFKTTGEQVLSGLINSENYSITMEKLASEIYILLLQSGTNVQTEKIFKY